MFIQRGSFQKLFCTVSLLILAGCTALSPEPTATLLPTATRTVTASATRTATRTHTPTITLTPSETLSPTPSQTTTPEPLTATATGNANCRWGPGTAYNGKSTFNEGQVAVVEARDFTNQWVYIQPPNFNQHCWVSVSAVLLNGDINMVGRMPANLPANSEVPVPAGVSAVRNGNNVAISWNAVADAPDVAYLLEVIVCQNGFLINAAYATENTSISIADGDNCSGSSSGTLRSSNALGYSAPTTIPWP